MSILAIVARADTTVNWRVGWCAVTVAGALRARNVWKTIGYHWLQKRNNPFVNCLGSVKIAIVCLMVDEKIRESTIVTRCIVSDVKHTWTETNICVLCGHSLISRRKMTLKAVRKKRPQKKPQNKSSSFSTSNAGKTKRWTQTCTVLFLKHIPNLSVALRVCEDRYLNTEDVCKQCGVREHVFRGDDTIDKFCEWLFGVDEDHKEVITIAHNARSYDTQFIQEYCHRHGIVPSVILNGAKILSLSVNEVKSN